jgi:tetratricopeptide (TPR) repeat protein
VAPGDPQVLYGLADLAWEHEDPATAAALVQEAIACHEGAPPPAWRVRLAEAFTRQGKMDDSVRAYQEAVAAAPDEVAAWAGLARTLQSLHHVADAIAAWERVLALEPESWQAQNDLGAALIERREWDRAQAAFDRAREAAPADPMIMVNRATLDVRRGRAADAVAALERCVAQFPGFAPAVAGLGFALRDLGKLDEAAGALRRALALSPDDSTCACGLARVLLEAGAAADALAAAQSHLGRRSGHAGALAVEALARLALGDREGADRLLDHDRFVAARELPLPEGFPDLATFNQAFAAHAATHRSLLPSPASHATAAGLHSGSLLVSPRGPVTAFEKALRTAVGQYTRSLPDIPLHPFLLGRPQAAFFNMWCVVLQSGGHQIPHIHPEAWLSGVYYPQVPEAIRTGAGPEGWLEFGYAERPFPSLLEPRIVRIRPAEGLLVMFPSYFYHRTVPFEADGTRISVAFDLVPAR